MERGCTDSDQLVQLPVVADLKSPAGIQPVGEVVVRQCIVGIGCTSLRPLVPVVDNDAAQLRGSCKSGIQGQGIREKLRILRILSP